MKIAIVSGHFMPEVGYQEVYLARAFARLGHRVRVFTTTSVSPSSRRMIECDYQAGLEKDSRYGFEVLRLKPSFRFRATILVRGLKRAVRYYCPDVAILVALRKMFAVSLLCHEVAANMKLVALFGEAKEYRDHETLAGRCRTLIWSLSHFFFKKRLYDRCVNHCHRLVMNIPEAEQLVQSWLSDAKKGAFATKRLPLNLGYDADEFYFSEADRLHQRRSLNIADDEVVVVTSTRITPAKRLEKVIDAVAALREQGRRVRFIMVGFLGDTYNGQLSAYIAQKFNHDIFHCYTFLAHEEVRRLFCAADLGVWLKAAISIQEAMGTGLPVVLENKDSVNHLVQDRVNGWLFEQGEFADALSHGVYHIAAQDPEQRNDERRRLADLNAGMLSYDKIAAQIVEGLA